jgi:hypothetical protein
MKQLDKNTRAYFIAREHRKRKRLLRESRKQPPKPSVVTIYVEAPQVFTITSSRSRKELLRFIAAIKLHLTTRVTRLCIDFRRTNHLVSDGTLLFYSELWRAINLQNKATTIVCKYPDNGKVEQALQKIGFFKLIGKPDRLNEDDFSEDVKHWRVATGEQVLGERCDALLNPYDGMIAQQLNNSLYTGAVEAMTNCVHHAYFEERGDGVSLENEIKRWWMFSQERDGELTVAICDLGVGIPRSFRFKKVPGWKQSIESFLSKFKVSFIKNPDGFLIKAAIGLGESRTLLPHRGMGLQQIVDVVATSNCGELLIHSNSGMYAYVATDNAQEKLVEYHQSIAGTIIQWKIPLCRASDHDGADRDN